MHGQQDVPLKNQSAHANTGGSGWSGSARISFEGADYGTASDLKARSYPGAVASAVPVVATEAFDLLCCKECERRQR